MMFGRDSSQPRLMILDHRSCRVELSLRPNGEPSLDLFDEKSILRTSVGAVTIKLPETGKTKKLSSAMAVFDKNSEDTSSYYRNSLKKLTTRFFKISFGSFLIFKFSNKTSALFEYSLICSFISLSNLY